MIIDKLHIIFMRKKYLLLLLFLVGAGIVAGFLVDYCQNRPANLQVAQIFHNSYFSQSEFFDQAYKAAKTADKRSDNIKAILVNHHLLAGNFIAESFNYIATTAPITVVLISPNHFSAGRGNFIASAGTWHTPYGDLVPDSALVKKLSDANLISVDESPFSQEHGASGIMPFVKKSLPNAKVVPVIVNDHVTAKQAQQIADSIYPLLPSNCLLVLSFDFSHYLTGRAADFHDVKSLAAIENFDLASISRLDSDSRPGLIFSLKLLKDFGNENFNLLENSNSSRLTHQDILETTSYITGYFTSGSEKSSLTNTFLVFPPIDISTTTQSGFDRYGKNFAVEYLERLFTGQDATMATVNSESINQFNQTLKRLGFTNISSKSQTILAGDLKISSLVLPPSATMIQKQTAAYAEIDKGADVVIINGQYNSPIETYKNKIIIYGQGSGLTDESLKDGSVSVAYGISLTNNNLTITILPLAAQGEKYKLLVGKQNDTILSAIAAVSYANISGQIRQGIINIGNFK